MKTNIRNGFRRVIGLVFVALVWMLPLQAVRGATLAEGYFHSCAVTSAGGVECWGDNSSGQLGNNSIVASAVPVPVTGLSSGVVAIAAGAYHSCALTGAGAVHCWGLNGNGQLGNNSTTQSLVPVAVTGLSSGVVATAGESAHTCALTSAGGVQCWGDNSSGELGNNSTTQSLVPVAVTGLSSGVVAIAVGSAHTCALTSAGGVQCWGGNADGQLGDNSVTPSLVPVAVTGLSSGAAAITVGGHHTCALTSAGAVQCWGYNANGQLGNNSTASSYVPVPVTGLSSGVVGITAGGGSDHTCALTSAGGVQCWGYNADGQLGNNSTANSGVPVPATGLSSGVVAVAPGGLHTCALTSGGGVQCWGMNALGQLGNNSTTNSSVPVAVAANISWMVPGTQPNDMGAIAAGGNHSCAITSAGGVECWGDNLSGELGNGGIPWGGSTNSLIPVAVTGLSGGVAGITAGSGYTCALTSAGAVQCWGLNNVGQLGNNSTTNALTPVPVTGLSSGVVAVTAGFYHACALTSAGGVLCWGWGPNGELGNSSTTALTPVPVTGLASGVVAIAAGSGHTCALTRAGGVLCWGNNTRGELGGGSAALQSNVPVAVTGLGSGVMAIAAGYQHSCALTTAGVVQCWGANNHGQLGDNSTVSSNVPVAVAALPAGIVAISAGSFSWHSCAVDGFGGLRCWGDNQYGELGNGTTTTVAPFAITSPVAVTGRSSGTVAVAAGYQFSCAITTAGVVQCWGNNNYGQLGNGGTASSSVPIAIVGDAWRVPYAPAAVRATLADGNFHSCAVTSAGGVECWGWNNSGQLGNNSTIDSITPVAVTGLSSGVVAVAAGGNQTCALLTSGGGVQCWGDNTYGQLGNGTTQGSMTPVAVTGLSGTLLAIAVGPYHTCALTGAGGVECWGLNNFGQLGNNSVASSSVPLAVAGMSSGVVAIVVGADHTCALTNTGGVQCWGYNLYGELGNNSTANSSVPVPVTALAGVSALAAGPDFTCALSGGGVECWGLNSNGQLGISGAANSLVPVQVTGLTSGVAGIAAGENHSCALTSGGGVLCWGYNGLGELGNGNQIDSSIPVPVTGMSSGVVSIAAGGFHTCALTNAGALQCWGHNVFGELGNGNNTNSNVPATAVPAPGSPAITGSTATAHLGLSAYTLGFAAQGVGTASAAQSIRLTNDGTAPLNMAGIAVSGDYSLLTNCGVSLAPGANCSISVSFAPTALGWRYGTLSIAAFGAGNASVVSLSGTGNPAGAAVGLSTGALAFGSWNVGSSSPTQTVTISNTGTANLTISGVSTAGIGDFGFVTNCIVPLAPGGTCTVTVTFTPAAAGTRTLTLTIGSNAASSPDSVSLSGTGIGVPDVGLSGPGFANGAGFANNTLNFVSQKIGLSSAGQTLTLTNTGTANLSISSIGSSGDYGQSNNCTTAALAPAATCTITVTFTPTASGARAGALDIFSNAAVSPHAVGLIGTGRPRLAMDFNADGQGDLLWYNAATGQTSAWLMNGLSMTSGAGLLTAPNWKVTATPDLNGDGKSDLLWYNAATGQTSAWLMNGTVMTSGAGLLTDPNWKVTATADLNGDGNADLIWYNAVTGETAAWLMNGAGMTSGAGLFTDPNWKVTATADLNGDGKADLIWYNAATGQTAAWLMNGSAATSTALLFTDPNWKVTATADLNGDGKADLIWYNAATGQTAAWLMNGSAATSTALLFTDPNWKVTATADLNGDGKADLIWYNAATGQTAAWLMNGSIATSTAVLLTDPNWKVTATLDLNGDGRADLIWYNAATGQTVGWLMNGLSMTSGAGLLTDPNWKATVH